MNSKIIKLSIAIVSLISCNIHCDALNSPAAVQGTSQAIIDATTAEQLNELTKTGKVVVDFHGEKWCQPCRSFAPIFAKVAASTPNVRFIKVDIDKFRTNDVRTVPTVIFYKDGLQVSRSTGYLTEAKFRSMITTNFSI